MKGKKRKKIIIVLIFIVLVFYVIQLNPSFKGSINNFKNKMLGKTLNKEFKVKIKSANLSTDYDIDKVIEDIDKLGLNTINVPVAVNIQSLTSDNMQVDKNSEKKAIKLIKKLRWKKINIILEPYPWIKNGELYETQWKPKNIDDFFWNWKNNVLKVLIDDVAVPYHVDALNVASNFVQMEYAEGYWCDAVDFVRKYYKGLITYRTCWWYTASWDKKTQEDYLKKLNNKVFSKVDFISIAAYFELTDKDENTIENLKNALLSSQRYNREQNIKDEIHSFNLKWNKPIFFGELGFPKRNKASVEPWNPVPSFIVNNKEQARCFKAYRIVFEKENWFLGFSVFAVGMDGEHKNYYPSEESIKVINEWYEK
ncbi:glycoside hydrolase family 113 [Haloimpatiens massiliensis]|uniref:glycoside hydrolase family 113 n=1 Tax=Haloimpatiens massiliensis TaxID=1658110 RepID=UPI000C83166B|nr:hydrolase [Haloimpatiens massiliensis]